MPWTVVLHASYNHISHAHCISPIDTPIFPRFYITLTSPDIRYSKLGGSNSTIPIASASGGTDAESAPAPLVGDIFSTSEDDLISIATGVGVAEYPLGTTFYGPRLWNGRLLYDVLSANVPCPTPATAAPTKLKIAQTEVVFEFLVQRPPEITEWDLYNLIDDSVTETVEGLLSGDSDDLAAMANKYNLELEEVVSVTSFGANLEGKKSCRTALVQLLRLPNKWIPVLSFFVLCDSPPLHWYNQRIAFLPTPNMFVWP